MVKKRQARAAPTASPIPVVAFDEARQPLGLEVLGLQELIAREVNHDLTRPQRTGFHHLLRINRGCGTHTVDFTRHELKAGSVLYIAPGQVQQFSLDLSLDGELIIFEPHFVRRTPPVWSGPRIFSVPRDGTVTGLMEAVAQEYQAYDGRAGSKALLQAMVETLMMAVREPVDEEGGGPERSLLERFESALEASFCRAHEVAAYAAVLNCSPRALTRACERASSRSAKRVIDERVVLEAKRLLAHGDQTAAEIAGHLGFAEATQFGKFFRRLAGDTPAAFRARFRRPFL
jgi:AraC-like DNA-binding protein